MTNPSQQPINPNLQKAKTEGKIRLQNIQKILREAFSQVVGEVKEGSREVAPIAKDFLTAKANKSQEQIEIKPEIITVVEITEEVTPVITEVADMSEQPEPLLVNSVAIEEVALTSEETASLLVNPVAIEDLVLTEVKATQETPTTVWRTLVKALLKFIQEKEDLASVREQYAKLKARLEIVDVRLMERYGDRYEKIKQQLKSTQPWYERQKSQMEVSGFSPMQRKQVEIHGKMAEAGTKVAQKEQQIKQQLKELWQLATKA